MPELLVKYGALRQNTAPTGSLETLQAWSRKYDWAERAVAYDSDYEGKKNEERAQVMENGLALDFERVKKLNKLADFLESQLYEKNEEGRYHNVWQPDVKQIGSGEYAERVDIERFNGSLISEYRGALDDIAKETGGRKVKTEMSGSLKLDITPSDLTDEQLANIAATGSN